MQIFPEINWKWIYIQIIYYFAAKLLNCSDVTEQEAPGVIALMNLVGDIERTIDEGFLSQ